MLLAEQLTVAFEAACHLLFFQAEDVIRDHCVTGVQTCALPILEARPTEAEVRRGGASRDWMRSAAPPREQRTGPRMSYIPPTSSGSTSRARSAVLTSFPKRSWISCSALV